MSWPCAVCGNCGSCPAKLGRSHPGAELALRLSSAPPPPNASRFREFMCFESFKRRHNIRVLNEVKYTTAEVGWDESNGSSLAIRDATEVVQWTKVWC